MKKALRITGIILGIILALLLLCLVAVQSPWVQSALGKKAVEMLMKKMDGTLTFDEISVKPFDAISLRNAVFIDNNPYPGSGQDTLAKIGFLSAKFSPAALLHGGAFYLEKARIRDGEFNLVMEPAGGKLTTNIQRVLNMKGGGETKYDWGDILHAGKLELENFRYSMKIMRNGVLQPQDGRHINWNNLDLVTNIRARDIKVKDGLVTAEVERMDIKEVSGFRLRNGSAKVKVGKGKIDLENLVLDDGRSDLHLNYLRFLGKLNVYGDFIDKVKIQADIAPSIFDMRTISYFTKGIDFITFRSDIKGGYNGYVNDFQVKDIVFHELASDVSGKINGGMIGLPDIQSTLLDYNVKGMRFTLNGLEKFVQCWAPGVKLGIDKIGKGENFLFDGGVNGPLNRMAVNGNAVCSAGAASADLSIRNVLNSSPIEIGGKLATRSLDVGKLTGIAQVHSVTANADVDATLGKPITADITLNASKLHILDYVYSGINLSGTYDGRSFDGNLVSQDPNLRLFMNGSFSTSDRTKQSVYNADLFIAKADLHALGLDKRETAGVRGEVHANFTHSQAKDLLGEISIAGLNLQDENGWHNLGNVNASVYNNSLKAIHRFNFNSNFATGSYMGGKSILSFVEDLKELTIRKELSALADKGASTLSDADYELNFNVRDASVVLAFLAPKVNIANGSSVKLKTTKEGQLYCFARSAKVSYGSNTVRNLVLDADNLSGGLAGTLKASQIKIGGIDLRTNNCALEAKDNKVNLDYSFAGAAGSGTKGNIVLSGSVTNDGKGVVFSSRVLPSSIEFKGEEWSITSDNITYAGEGLSVRKLIASSNQQTIKADGGYSTSDKDTLHVDLDHFDISLLNHFIMNGKLQLEGKASGSGRVLSDKSGFTGLVARITSDNTRVAGNDAGDVLISSAWNTSFKRFDVNLHNRLDGVRNFEASGHYTPSTQDLMADLDLNSFNLSYFAPVLESLFSEFEGLLSGKIHAYGKPSGIHFESRDAYLKEGKMTIGFTRVPYYVEGPVAVTDDGLFFNKVNVKDGNGGTGTIGGGILFGGFKDIRTDIHIQMNSIKALNIKHGENKSFYGDISASGKVDVTGPFDDILLAIDGTTVGSGNLHIPLSESSSDTSGNLLTFKTADEQEGADNDEMDSFEDSDVEKVSGSSNLTVQLRARATPDVTAWIDIGENTLSGIGSGIIDIESRSADEAFTINGDYTLTSGNFHFSAMNIVSRDFALENGSAIRFNGDIMDSDLNINGLYVTKTSLSNLLADSTSTRRTVNCGIHITDKLRNPKIELSIDVPDLDPTTKAMVDAALNTDDKVQKQFLYLLIAGTFLPSEESGITTGGSSMLFSNVTSIMSGQLNNIFQKLDIPLDLGLNYQPNDRGNDLFDVALSTQLFNNRVIVNGNIGSKRGTGTTTYGDIAGDVDVEIKITKDGSLRGKLFSHSADVYSNYLDNSQRNGAGITYQREFRTFKQFFRDLFSSRKERKERLAEEAADTSSVSVRIDTSGKATPIVPNE